jgi:predicted O-methyltransferase YrrM
MTDQQYLERNAKGFEGDSFLKSKIEKICNEYAVEIIVETGTFRGASTLQFAKMAETVYTVEINRDNLLFSRKLFSDSKVDNVISLEGSSDEVLENVIIPELKLLPAQNIFFFLDAHWGDHNPLHRELELLEELEFKPIIAIHDFYNPNYPHYGYDTYQNGTVIYNWDYIKDHIERLYDGKYTIDYNEESEGAQRGVIFIYPKTE